MQADPIPKAVDDRLEASIVVLFLRAPRIPLSDASGIFLNYANARVTGSTLLKT